MKKMLIIAGVFLACTFAVQAQNQQRGPRQQGPRQQGPSVEQMIERFDTNGNKELDAQELQAMREAVRERMQVRQERPERPERPERCKRTSRNGGHCR